MARHYLYIGGNPCVIINFNLFFLEVNTPLNK